jgi:Flp pilus assembly protein TadG
MIRNRGQRPRGQALVEFAIALPIFLVLLMGVFDLGRAIYQYNGVSEAAREIARVTSVHPGTTLGNSTETAAVVATQKGLIPNLASPTFTCIDIDGSTLNTSTTCVAGNQVKVVIVAPYRPVTPLLGLIGTWNMQSTSAVSIQ